MEASVDFIFCNRRFFESYSLNKVEKKGDERAVSCLLIYEIRAKLGNVKLKGCGWKQRKMKKGEIALFILESFDVAVDFPIGYLGAVKIPFPALLSQEIIKRSFTQSFTH